MFAIRPTPEELAQGLESWDWLDFNGLQPVLVSSFGDVFFEGSDGIQMLDTIEGKLKHIASDRRELESKLATEQGQDEFLLAGLVIGARDRLSLTLQDGECYDFKVPPILSGAIGVENLQKMSFVVKLNLCGQLHKQVKDLAPGTRINGVKLEES
jgi:hypothetical protein